MKKLGKLLGLCVASGALLTACGGPTPEPPPADYVTDAPSVAEATPSDNAVAVDNAAMADAAVANNAAEVVAVNEAVAAPTPAETPAAEKAATPTPTPSPAAAKVVERPAQFAMCTVCHSVEKGGPNKIGPNLFGVVGSKAGSKPDFAYSDAMKGSGITWTPGELESFLLAPQAKVPGTKMMVKGPADEKARQAIVDYLATLK